MNSYPGPTSTDGAGIGGVRDRSGGADADDRIGSGTGVGVGSVDTGAGTPSSLEELVRLLLGAASLVADLLVSASPQRRAVPPQASSGGLPRAADAALGVGVGAVRLAWRGTATARRAARPLTGLVLRPPLLNERYWPETLLTQAAERGRRERVAAVRDTSALARALVPRVVSAVLDELDLTSLVVERVDLDAAAEHLDLDAAAARIDLDSIVDRVPIDRVVDRLDLDGIAGRIDLDRVVKRVDVDAIVASVNVDAVAARIDLDAIVNRLDLIGIARYIVEALDLPEIIRQSSSSMASDAVREVRMQSMQADERVSRTVDRLLLRRRGRRTQAPGEAVPAPDPDPHAASGPDRDAASQPGRLRPPDPRVLPAQATPAEAGGQPAVDLDALPRTKAGDALPSRDAAGDSDAFLRRREGSPCDDR